MSDVQMIGVVVIALGSLLGLFATIVKIFVAPVNDLVVSVSKLDSTINTVNREQIKTNKKLDYYGTRIEDIDIKLARNNID